VCILREWSGVLLGLDPYQSRLNTPQENTEGRQASPAFLFNGALSMFERHGFKRSRLIGKHKWVVTRTVR
jgi:hypothetical protein